jgi:GTPase
MLDRVEIRIKGGNGGGGAVTFRREKYVPFGGPSGGDGGIGGSVIIKADESVSTLMAYKYKRSFKAQSGQNGMSKNKHGKNGEDLILTVPPGTLVYEKEGDNRWLLADLTEQGQKVTAAAGGRGGLGNSHFATATNQTPNVSEPGRPGQEKTIILEMRVIADVGIIGYPNVGKSTLLSVLSAAHPEIDNYPFTTIEPVLGVVNVDDLNSFVTAEIPGLIEGAHEGKGLGHNFLKHAMRTRVLIHLLDGTADSPLDNMVQVNNELVKYDAELAERKQVVAINKCDLPEVKNRIKKIKEEFAAVNMKPVFISAEGKIGLKQLVDETWQVLNFVDKEQEYQPEQTVKVFKPQPVDAGTRITRQGDSFILKDPAVERLLSNLDLNDEEDLEEFNEALEKLGINKLLKEAGIKSGSTVITDSMEWEWYDS